MSSGDTRSQSRDIEHVSTFNFTQGFHTSINSCRTAVGPQSTRQETNSRSQLTHLTMRLLSPLILSLTALSSCVFAQDAAANKVKYDYQVGSDSVLY